MSVEGMWAVRFGDAGAPVSTPNGGVVIFETGRLFGGDSLMAYTGRYSVTDTGIVAHVHTFKHEPGPITDAFGGSGGPLDLIANCQITGDRNIAGTIGVPGGLSIPIRMWKVSELP